MGRAEHVRASEHACGRPNILEFTFDFQAKSEK